MQCRVSAALQSFLLLSLLLCLVCVCSLVWTSVIEHWFHQLCLFKFCFLDIHHFPSTFCSFIPVGFFKIGFNFNPNFGPIDYSVGNESFSTFGITWQRLSAGQRQLQLLLEKHKKLEIFHTEIIHFSAVCTLSHNAKNDEIVLLFHAKDQEIKAYCPSKHSVCWRMNITTINCTARLCCLTLYILDSGPIVPEFNSNDVWLFSLRMVNTPLQLNTQLFQFV